MATKPPDFKCPECGCKGRRTTIGMCIPCTKRHIKNQNKQLRNTDAAQKKLDAIAAERERLEIARENEKMRLALEITQSEEAEAKAFIANEAAVAELAERERCRRNFLPFVYRFEPDYDAGWVHADICRRLEQFERDVLDGKSPRLILTMPPRHGKSALVSKTFPAWFLGRNPKKEIISCSYNQALAMDFSRKVRGIMQDDDFLNIFPDAPLDPKSQSAERWNTDCGGGYVSAGVSTGITGRGCHVGLIDDPIKDRDSAESETVRESVKNWYSSTFYTRLAPGAGVCIVQTRWHEDDLAGWLIKTFEEAKADADKHGEPIPDDVDQWEIINYPAIAVEDETYRKKGDALHEARYPLPALAKIKRTLLPRDWEALYMQRPTSDDGEYFTKVMLRYYDTMPLVEDMKIYAAWDLAISTKEHADYTCCFVIGVDRSDNVYVLDRVYGRFTALQILDNMFAIQRKWRPEIVGIESGQIELTLEPFLIKRQLEEKLTIPYRKLKTRGKDKATRARTVQGRMEQGRVFLPKSAIWTQDLVNELLKFPLGLHDDQVDAIAWVFNMLILFSTVRDVKAAKKKSWRDKLKKYTGLNSTSKRTSMGA